MVAIWWGGAALKGELPRGPAVRGEGRSDLLAGYFAMLSTGPAMREGGRSDG